MDAKDNGISFFQLSFYGESLLDPLIAEKIRLIFKHIPQAWVLIVTNGSLLTKENSQKLLDSGISEIRVSIEGNTKEEYEKIRRGLSFDQLVENMNCLKSIRDNNKNYSTHISVTGLNLKTCPLIEPDYRDFWIKYSDEVLIKDEHIIKLDRKESILEKLLPCPRLFTMLPVLADGKCAICISDWHGEKLYGHLNTSTINKVWFNPQRLIYKSIHLLGLKKP